jgi:streptogramin lyase
MKTLRNITRTVPLVAVALATVALVALAAPRPTTKVIRLGSTMPDSVTAAYGSIWASSHVGLDIYRIDPRTNTIVKRISIGENQCLPITSGAGAIWTTNCWGETGHAYIYEVSATTNRVVHRLDGRGVVFGDGSLWTMAENRPTLLRIDPHSLLVLARIPMPSGATGQYGPFVAAECDGALWVNADTAEVRVDVATNRVLGVIQLPGSVSDSTASNGYFSAVDAACAGGKAWVPNLAGLYSIDEKTNTATRLPVAIKPNSGMGDPGLTASGTQVFVRTSDRTVTQVDATTGKTVHIYPASGGGGGQLTVANGSIWIPVFSKFAIWRELVQRR